MGSEEFGEYKLSEPCESGAGCGNTLQAQHSITGQPAELQCASVCPFASKQAALHQEDSSQSRDLRRHLKGLRHPHMIAVRDVVVNGRRLAYVTDPVASISLREYLDRSSDDPSLVARLDLLLPVGEALAHLHRGGYAHGRFGPDTIQVLEVAGRAFLASLPPCAALGVLGHEDCHPEDYPECPSSARDGGLPTVVGDVSDFVAVVTRALLADGAAKELSPALADFLGQNMETAIELPDLLDRLETERSKAQLRTQQHLSPAQIIRRGGLKRKLSQSGSNSKDTTTELVPSASADQLASRFYRLRTPVQLAVLLGVAALSSRVPVEKMWGPTPSPATVVTRPRPRKPRPAHPKPKPVVKVPESVRNLLEVAEAVWKHPTDKRNFASRLSTVWAFTKDLPRDQRADVGGKKALLGVRRLTAKSPAAGHRELDRLIGKCRELLRRSTITSD